jgi:hypothetical protein
MGMWAAGYLLAPAMLIWGWMRWATLRHEVGRPSSVSFVGLILSTASAMLALSAILYAAAIHSFAYYDPALLRIFRWGFLLSLAGFVLGLTGVAKANSLRWQAPAAGFAMLAFWFVAASSE